MFRGTLTGSYTLQLRHCGLEAGAISGRDAVSRSARNLFVAMNDNVAENRFTGALVHVLQQCPELLNQVVSDASDGRVDLHCSSVHSTFLQKTFPPWGRPDALLELDVTAEVTRSLLLETKAGVMANGEEPSQPLEESEQLSRYEKAASRALPKGTVLAYLTADVAKPSEFVRLEKWVNDHSGSHIVPVWIQWNNVYGRAAEMAAREDTILKRVLADFVGFLEESGMVSDRLTLNEAAAIGRVTQQSNSDWATLNRKSYDMLVAFRTLLKATHKLKIGTQLVPRRLGLWSAVTEDASPLWYLYARWNTKLPVWVTFDLQLASAYLQVTVRFDGESSLRGHDDYLQWFEHNANGARERVQHMSPQDQWNPPPSQGLDIRKRLGGHKLVTLAQWEEPQKFGDFNLARLMEFAEHGQGVISKCLTPA